MEAGANITDHAGALHRAGAHPTGTAAPDALWYQNAIIYQMHVRSFADSDGDGIGDFAGLIARLDYLEELGVTALWLLPFYPSPLKDDGYDIADYTDVHPAYGTMDDVRRFIDEAHRREIRVITELVINHTSDQHPWFIRARRAPKGSPERDFYVWSDSPAKYAGVRVIFQEFEPSNWTFDPVADQYYWHRFFHHQPDLNYDNPAVHDAIFRVCDFWMAAGVDGVRLDAIPYLYERDGTSCENLPETHAFLRKLRRHVDERWPGRMLLAEANQWPEDAVTYFGGRGASGNTAATPGDECHMSFHFPLMPRLFMALRMEDRYPIIDILEQTPPLPPGAQWAVFLRNHDELTLEMVTDEERDYMWRVYAADPAARINMGIRRRLAPLLNNNRRTIELMNGLLFSMPGTPIVYYGDEIGMGDNIFLGDRNGVRTPMQWSADRNAGFSRADPQRLVPPLITTGEYHYETVNVETQHANPSSLLWWMRRLIALRKRHPVFGTGALRFLSPNNPKVLAFVRHDANETVLVVANLSRFAQYIKLDLTDFVGWSMIEMFGNSRFPAIDAGGSYALSLSPHSFNWFVLGPPVGGAGADASPAESALARPLRIGGLGFADTTSPGLSPMAHSDFDRLLAGRLPLILPTRRWFVSKARTIRSIRIIDRIDLESSNSPAAAHRAVFLLFVEYTEGEPDIYALPASATLVPQEADLAAPPPPGVLLTIVDSAGRSWWMRDGMTDEGFAVELLQIAISGDRRAGKLTGIRGRATVTPPPTTSGLTVKISDRQQSNSSVLFGDQLILKLFRRLAEGTNPELEIGEHLAAVGFAHAAPIFGAIELIARQRAPVARRTLAVVGGYVANQGDAWTVFLDHAHRYFEHLATLTPEVANALCFPSDEGCVTDADAPPASITAAIAEPLALARLIGQRTAELHAALADDRTGDLAFAVEPYNAVYQRSLLQSMRNTTRTAMTALADSGRAGAQLAQDDQPAGLTTATEAAVLAAQVLGRERDIMGEFHRLLALPIRGPRIRIHGDYHLGQLLWTGKDFVVIDFEGEPLRSIGERRLKRSPMRDVAGMIRSFDYAAWAALRRHWQLLPPAASTDLPASRRDRGIRGARVWSAWLAREFVRAHIARLGELRTDLLPPTPDEIERILRTWLLDKALYEVGYELNARPDWVDIPLRAVLRLLAVNSPPPADPLTPE